MSSIPIFVLRDFYDHESVKNPTPSSSAQRSIPSQYSPLHQVPPKAKQIVRAKPSTSEQKQLECSTASRNNRLSYKSTIPSNPPPPLYFFLGPNLGAPISLPRSLIPKTFSIAARIFWSGAADPRSKSATILCVVLHLVARSFCVIFGSIFCLCWEMASPTSFPTVLGLTISSLRSTLVRCWPSMPGLDAYE